jgi:hypothetical protein
MSDAPAIASKSEQAAASLMITCIVKEPSHRLEIFGPRIDFTLFYIFTLVGTNGACMLFKFNRVYIGLFGDKDSSLLII